MDIIKFEINKILYRRYALILLLGTTILFPIIVKVISHLNVIEDKIPEGLFPDNLAFYIISYTQTYFFLPLWIIVIVGNELTQGHVNRVTFSKSRHFYFIAKLFYCTLVATFFSIVGLITLLISVETSPYSGLDLPVFFYASFFLQLFFSSLLFSLLLLCLVVAIKSPLKTFILYFVWTVAEGIIFTVFNGLYQIKATWLPLHLVRTIYAKNGELQLANYMPFTENFFQVIPVFVFVLGVTFITYKFFLKSNLPVMSD